MGKLVDMTGYKSGRLTVLRQDGSKNGQSMWLCQCSCGNTCTYAGGSLRKGKVKSCGCYYKEVRKDIAHISIAKTKHGDSFSRLYYVWNDIKSRCNNPKDISYKNYGALGISVCDEWAHDYLKFKNWAMANGYDPTAERGQCTIDRVDVHGNYEPSNCRWISAKEQASNKRNTCYITYGGKTLSARAWADITGIPRGTIYSRYKRGWAPKEILSRCKYDPAHNIISEYEYYCGKPHGVLYYSCCCA